MIRHDRENSTSKRHRASRACDNCRLRKTKCGKVRPCTMCMQNKVRCTDRPKRLPLLELQESNETLAEAVHALCGIYRPDIVVTNTEITTEDILERLGLNLSSSSKESSVLIRQNMECTADTKSVMPKSPESTNSRFGIVSNTAYVDLACGPESLKEPVHSSQCSDQYQSSITTISEPRSLSTEEYLGCVVTSADAEPIEPAMLTLTSQQKSSFLHNNGLLNFDSVVHNDFDLYLEPMVEETPAGPPPIMKDEFGFDPPMRLSAPSEMDWVISSSVCTSMKDDVDDFERFCSSASQLTTTTESSWSVSDVNSEYAPTADLQSINQPVRATARSLAPNTSKLLSQTDRPRKTPQTRRNNPVTVDDERRVMSLEKNRLAAAKCRGKRKIEVDKLKEASVAAKSENNLLKQQATKLREEIMNLCGELLTHISRSACCEQEKWRTALNVMAKEVTAGGHVGGNAKIAFEATGS